MLYSPGESHMSSLAGLLNEITVLTLLQLVAILLIAVALNRFLRKVSEQLIRPAGGPSRAEQARETQTRALADIAYGTASKLVWAVAALTALYKVGISPTPALVLGAVIGLAIGLGAQNLVRDVIGGWHIVLEDQYSVGDTVEIGDTSGRVEQF